MRITKFFRTLASAEKFHNSLYSKYDDVKLISSPMFSEEGAYTWVVK